MYAAGDLQKARRVSAWQWLRQRVGLRTITTDPVLHESSRTLALCPSGGIVPFHGLLTPFLLPIDMLNHPFVRRI